MSDNQKLVDLASFRKQKGLKQIDVANQIGTSGSFISLVETGSAKLPDDKIEILINYYGPSGLVPCYDRLVNLQVRLVKDNYLEPYHLETDNLPFEEELTRPIVETIKYGRMGITKEIADKIVAAFPAVNEGWLLSGEGDMFYDNTELRLKNIEDSLRSLHEKIDWIASQLTQANIC